MPLKIDDTELFAVDSHTHMGRRNTPLGHGVASFLGDDLVRNMDELGIDKAVAFPLGAPYTDYSESNATIAAEVAKFPQRDHRLLPYQSQLRPAGHGQSSGPLL